MTPWRARLEKDSKAAVRRGIRELRKTGWIKAGVKSIYYARPTLQYQSFGWKRLAVVILHDGITIIIHVMRTGDSMKWYTDTADIRRKSAGELIMLSCDAHRRSAWKDDPVVWRRRTAGGSDFEGPILKFWDRGYSLTELRKIHRLSGGPKLFPGAYSKD